MHTATQSVERPVLERTLAAALDAGSVLLVAGAGYGKTTALEQATEPPRHALWVACGDARGDAGRLLVAIVEGLRTTLPGLADVVWDRLASGVEWVDVAAATAALVSELERLLVEPLVVVFDDAEALEDDPVSLALVDQLLNVRGAPLSVAIATRRPLRLRLAKLRAAGRLVELGPAELSFTASECEELLRLRHGRAVTEDEVAAAIAATEGWPMGVALTSLTGAVAPAGRDELFTYLAEEVLDRLEPAMARALVDSSVPATVTPALADALGLPPGFLADAERLGLFLRAHPSGDRSYHPLFRAFLLERLHHMHTEAERASLHARAAEHLAAAGRHDAAIEHWLDAGDFQRALEELAAHGPELVRISPAAVAGWLSRLPRELRRAPDAVFLDGQLLWLGGQHEQALDPLRAAVSAYAAAGLLAQEWLARSVLADALISIGAFDEMVGLAQGWDAVPAGPAQVPAATVAWYQAFALVGLGACEEAEALLARLRADPATAREFRAFDGIARVGLDPAAGRGRETLAWLRATAAELEREDPHGSLPYALAMQVVVLRDLGEREEALACLDRCEREAERVGMGFVARDCQLQRSFLLAEEQMLSRAEIELARAGRRRGAGWRGMHREQAEAHVAALRGDARGAVGAAQRALERIAPGPIPFRVWTAVDLAELLAAHGAPDLARAALDDVLVALDAHYPGPRGRLHRARLLASRAYLESARGEPEAANVSLRRCWEEAGAEADQVVRAHWRTLRPVLWHALATGAIAPDAVLPAVQGAFPGGEAVVAMIDHPDPAVRRAALLTVLAAGHPAVLSRLEALGKDRDEQVASAAAAARERLRALPPPLRFELLGGFRVKRAGWELDEATWKRPMAARVVRFLLLQGGNAVPEDTLFEAFWNDRPATAARRHLAVAVSRARKVLDLPGAGTSVIEARERTFRLRLRERDSVDSADFERAAAGALAARDGERREALERAAALWTGEPLPEDRYATWSFAWRERLAETYCQVLSALIDGYERSGAHHDAIRAAQRLLEVDPLNERAHRQLMAAYARTGRTSYALRQYLECRRALVVELGVEPSAETSRLQARILAGAPV